MPAGPKITDEVKMLIAQVYLQHKDWVAKQVMEEVHTQLIKKNPDITPNWPGLSAIQIELKKIRHIREKVQGRGEDEKWSVGKSVKHSFPPGATSDLLTLWRYCLAAGLEFTVRHAKWACYIRGECTRWRNPYRHEEFDAGSFYHHCCRYSNRERVCELLGIDLETADLDGFLAMSSRPWELHTAMQVGGYKLRLKEIPDALPDKGIMDMPRVFRGGSATQVAEAELGIEGLAFSDLESLSDEVDKVYAYWLRYISKGPNWEDMSPHDRSKTAQRLLDDIKVQASNEKRELFWDPREILREVGYRVMLKEAQNEGQHSQEG